MTAWRWVGADVIFAIHDRQIAEHGGLDGVRDRAMLESAVARPQNLSAYGGPDAASLAAAYAFGFARNHGFADGNRRTAWIVARVFLADNGLRVRFDAREAIRIMEDLASGKTGEDELARWFRARIVRID